MHTGELIRRWADAERDHATEPVGDAPWPLHPPATASEVFALEERLGSRLPPSYRQFLLASNGTESVETADVETRSHMHGFYSIGEVGWLKDVDRQLIDIWMESAEPEHVDHTPVEPDPWISFVDGFCGQCMPGTLAIADADEWLLLNPGVIDSDGEWECWRFGSWIPGAFRYRSFRTYLEACAQQLDPNAVGVPDPYVLAADAARDELLPERKRLDAISTVISGPHPEQALAPALSMMGDGGDPYQPLPILSLQRLLQQGFGEESIVKMLVPLCSVPVDPGKQRRFEAAVCALALSRHPDAIAAVKAVLQDVDSAHSLTLQELLRPADPLDYAAEWWQLWEVTGDPAYLLKLGYAGDGRAIEQMRQVLANPRRYRPARGAIARSVDMTTMRMKYLLDNRAT